MARANKIERLQPRLRPRAALRSSAEFKVLMSCEPFLLFRMPRNNRDNRLNNPAYSRHITTEKTKARRAGQAIPPRPEIRHTLLVFYLRL